MALTVTASGLANVTTAESTTDWSLIGSGGGVALEPDFFAQGSNCISVGVSGTNKKKGGLFDYGTSAGVTLDFSATGGNENELIYIWIRCSTPGLIKTIANGGCGIQVGDGTNYSEFHVGGSDFGFPDTRGFICFVIDPTLTPSAISGTLNLAAVSHIGAFIETTATAKGQNLGIDRIAVGRGELRGTGTATTGLGFKDMADWDFGTIGNRWGLTDVRNGVIYCRCKLIVGDDVGVLGTTFTSNDETLVWETPMYHDGTSRVKAVPDADEDGANYWGLEFVGNATAATNVTIGTVVGSFEGRSGSTFSVAENPDLTTPARQEWRLVGDDGNVNNVDLYACTFKNCERASPDNAFDFNGLLAADSVFSSTFDACGRIDFGALRVRNSRVLNSYTDTNDGAVIWDADTDIEDTGFLNNIHSLVFEATTGQPFTFTRLSFNPTALGVRNESLGEINISSVGGDVPTAENSGGGSVTNITATVPVDVHVESKAGVDLLGAQVTVRKVTPDTYTSAAGNAQGDLDFVVSTSLSAAHPVTGWFRVLHPTTFSEQMYRYASYLTSTFTLPTKVGPHACSGGGTGRLLQDTVRNLTSIGIEVGDTIRNETDGSWCIAKEVVDADNVITTQLQGGTDDTWSSGDTWSINSLAFAYGTTETVYVPVLSSLADATGDAAITDYNYGGDVAIEAKARLAGYKPGSALGTIVSETGVSLTIILDTSPNYGLN
jgi:hypothetical protein